MLLAAVKPLGHSEPSMKVAGGGEVSSDSLGPALDEPTETSHAAAL